MSRRAVDPSLNNINAALLTDAQIAGLGVAECSALIEQLDQQLVNSLQETDANFLRATRAVTDKILPAVEKYGESSREIWQSVKVNCMTESLCRELIEFGSSYGRPSSRQRLAFDWLNRAGKQTQKKQATKRRHRKRDIKT